MLSPRRLFPFLDWFPLSAPKVRADVVAGVTVALVLIPQSMAYAQLAGLPAYYGLYAAFLPVAVAALWGSSRQLATGPVAMVSLLTGATLSQFAAPGSEQFIAYAIALALMVGVMELAMGLFRLGAVVNFLSHPVIVGFTNAAAIIIALSQLNKFLGVSAARSDSFIADTWAVLQQAGETHLPTLAMGGGALVLMLALRRFAPRLPAVLIAVAATTLLSWSIGYERNGSARLDDIADPEARRLAIEYTTDTGRIDDLARRIEDTTAQLKGAEHRALQQEALALRYEIEVMRLEAQDLERENRVRMRALRKFVFEREAPNAAGASPLVFAGHDRSDTATDRGRWRIRRVTGDRLELIGGGEVVGAIPSGIPEFKLPRLSWDMLATLLKTAFVITLVGFMEAISIAKAMATKTRQRIDPDQELVGQGLANIVAGLTQAFPVSGSFSRSALNLAAGARTGLSSIFTALAVLLTLLVLTPLLHHLPKPTLAAVIILAVISLLNFRVFQEAWSASRQDGIAAATTFAATLLFAPNIQYGMLIGIILALAMFLFRTMKPRIVLLGLDEHGELQNADRFSLPRFHPKVAAIRFDGRLYFANVSYFEENILYLISNDSAISYVLVDARGINGLDASGVAMLRNLVTRLNENGITLAFYNIKLPVLEVMQRTGLQNDIQQKNIFLSERDTLKNIKERLEAGSGF